MPLPPLALIVHPTRDEKRKIEWLAARRNLTAHAWWMELMRRELARHPDPPFVDRCSGDDD